MQKLVAGIHRFQSDVFQANQELFDRLRAGQAPQALFIGCSDSRVIPDLITQSEPGDLFVLRNAGNLVPPHGAAPDSGEAATIEYAIHGLHIRDIIVCGHTGCGAMQALLHPELIERMPRMRRWLVHAEATRAILQSKYTELDPEPLWKAAVEENVLVQIENLRTHPQVAAGLANRTLSIHGWVYKIETGQVFAYNPKVGQFLSLAAELPPQFAGVGAHDPGAAADVP